MSKALLLFILCFIGTAWASNSPSTVSYVDLPRYMGKWYEIARIPNTFQKSCVQDVSVSYQLLPNNQVVGINTCRKVNGEIFNLAVKGSAQDKTNAKLVFNVTSTWLRWIPMLKADYWIVDLAKDYSHAAVATADSQYLWLLSRQPKLDDGTYQLMLDRLATRGFDVKKLVKNSNMGV